MEILSIAMPALADAWSLILQPTVLMYLLLGVTMGLAIGVFPGLGGIAGLSLVLPFMFGLEPSYGLALMIGMVAFIAETPSLDIEGMTQPATVLPVQVFLWYDGAERAFEPRAAAAIMVLLGLMISFNALAIYLRHKFERRW